MEQSGVKRAALLIACLLLPLLAGAVGSAFTMPAIPGWYAGLAKPSFSPPNWVFGPVWTTLYILMGLALFLVVREGIGSPQKRTAAGLFAVQLGLNVLWSVVFFGLQSPAGAFIVIIALVSALSATLVAFRKVSPAAAWLLVPYLCWTSFATLLNAMIVILN